MRALASEIDYEGSLSRILLNEEWHCGALEALRKLAPFAWVTGGFVRNAIWDTISGHQTLCLPADVDVVYLESRRRSLLTEESLTRALEKASPGINWSVRDQARMHLRNSDPPYQRLDMALRSFPDRSSAIAVRLLANGDLEILAPFGLEDAFRGVVRPAPLGLSDDRFHHFLERKLPNWEERWPWLKIVFDDFKGEAKRRVA